MDISEKFVSVMQGERKAREYSLRRVEKETGISSVVIHSWESGKQSPSLKTINRIFHSGEFGKHVVHKWIEALP